MEVFGVALLAKCPTGSWRLSVVNAAMTSVIGTQLLLFYAVTMN